MWAMTSTRSRRRVRTALLGLSIAALLGAAACSDSDATVSGSMQSGQRPGVAELGPDDSTPDSSAPDEGGTRPPQDEGGDDSDYCRRIQDFANQGAGPTDDPEALLDALEDLQGLAPEDLRDDYGRVIETIRGLTDLDASDPKAFGDLLERLLDPDTQAAFGEISTYTLDECGVDLDGTGLDSPGLDVPSQGGD